MTVCCTMRSPAPQLLLCDPWCPGDSALVSALPHYILCRPWAAGCRFLPSYTPFSWLSPPGSTSPISSPRPRTGGWHWRPSGTEYTRLTCTWTLPWTCWEERMDCATISAETVPSPFPAMATSLHRLMDVDLLCLDFTLIWAFPQWQGVATNMTAATIRVVIWRMIVMSSSRTASPKSAEMYRKHWASPRVCKLVRQRWHSCSMQSYIWDVNRIWKAKELRAFANMKRK